MFGKSNGVAKATIDSLVGLGTVIEGNVLFSGGLRIDGEVRGNVIAQGDKPSMLVLSENARIVGSVRAAQLVVNGAIEGPVHADILMELQPKARVVGDITYKALEMHHGAMVEGRLSALDGAKPALKLATTHAI
jgi:cytoskeletal protein CcmA (bactofilin family)